MVSKLNPPQRSVTVEWYERGETKGKEVELDMLLELNPELIRGKQSSYTEPPPSALPINLQRVSRRFLCVSHYSSFGRDEG
jgi:kinesin family member 2/24